MKNALKKYPEMRIAVGRPLKKGIMKAKALAQFHFLHRVQFIEELPNVFLFFWLCWVFVVAWTSLVVVSGVCFLVVACRLSSCSART